MSGRRRHPTHRAIIYGGVLGGMTNERINELLHEVKERPLPKSSYESIRKHYLPYFRNDMSRLGAAIESPPTWSALKEAGERDISQNVVFNEDPVDDD